jgi:hypothetical protein
MFAAADHLLADGECGEDAAAIRRLAAPDAKPGGKRRARRETPSPAEHAENGQWAALRSGWQPTDMRLAVSYADPQVRIEVGAGRHTFITGSWDLDIKIGGLTAQRNSAWDEVCWYSDNDVDYVEIEAQFTENLRVQRQILLAREDRFLFLADAILAGSEPAALEYSGLLPLASAVGSEAADETCESYLTVNRPAGRARRALVLPLALPEWRSAARKGSLTGTAAGIELRQAAHGRSLLAPLLIDLDRRRLNKSFTWRRLTVAESLEALPDDAAAGYRIEIGKQQWLIYRSLIAGGVRSVLGQQLSREFMVARFPRGAVAERLLEIEMA